MEGDRSERIHDLAQAAAERPDGERRGWVLHACAGDESLADEVLRRVDTPASAGPGEPADEADLAGVSLAGLRLEREIGRGGMGTVYAARREVDGAHVAVKVYHADLLDAPGMRERFEQEIAVGSRLRHPNVVRTLDGGVAEIGGRRRGYLVMELVAGRTLRGLLDDLGTVPESLLREIALQVTRGLRAIHEARIVHRDLKPENVLITDDQRARIMDLGVAKVLEASPALTTDGAFLGSLPYASPEQCEGTEVGPAADLYALGAVLYELASGTNPFERENIAAVVRAHLDDVPTMLDEVDGTLSPFLAEVVDVLLAKQPGDRFPSAAALEAALESGESGTWWRERRRGRARPHAVPPTAGPLAGREEELSHLTEAWRDAREGCGGVVLVEGEAGIGKSHLVDALMEEVARHRGHVVYATSTTGGIAGGIEDALLEQLAGGDLETALARYLPGTPALVPPAAAWLRGEPGPSGSPALEDRAWVGLLCRLLQGMARERPTLWVVEDAHQGEAELQELLPALARAAVGHRALLLVTARTPTAKAPSRPRAALDRLDNLRILPLERLDEGAVERLAANVLGDEDAAARIGREIALQSDGVPLFAIEILRGLGGDLAPGTELDALEALEVPAALRDLVLTRLLALGDEDRALLDAAAVQGQAFAADVVAHVRGLSRLPVLEALGRIERREGLVRSAGRGMRFDHHLVQEVIYEQIAIPLREELHAATAEALEAASPPPVEAPGEMAWRIAHHHLRGARPAGAAPWIRQALAHLDATFRTDAAVDLARRALAVSGLLAGEARVDALLAQCGRLRLRGRQREALIVSGRAEALARELDLPSALCRACQVHAMQLITAALYDEAARVATENVERARKIGDETARVESLGALGQIAWCRGAYEEARRWHEQAAAAARESGLTVSEARALSNLAIVRQEQGYLDEARRLLERVLEICEEHGDWRTSLPARTNLGNALHDAGEKREALALYESVLRRTRDLAFREAETIAWVNVAFVRLRWGALAEARRAFQRSLVLSREIDAPRVEGYALQGLGEVAAAEGDRSGARVRFEEALAVRRSIGNPSAEAETLIQLGRLAWEAGGSEEARKRIEEALERAAGAGDGSTLVVASAYRALLPGGEAAPAEARLAEHETRMSTDARLEAHLRLWQATGRTRHLQVAHDILEAARADAPPSQAESLVACVPLHRAVRDAWREAGPQGGEPGA